MTQAIINCTNTTKASGRSVKDIWSVARNAAAAAVFENDILYSGMQYSTSPDLYVRRSWFRFDTSVIPSTAIIASAVIRLVGGVIVYAPADTHTIYAMGANTSCPHIPAVLADFDVTNYPLTLGSVLITGLVWQVATLRYAKEQLVDTDIVFTSDGRTAINKGAGAITGIAIVPAYDHDNSPPPALYSVTTYAVFGLTKIGDAGIKLIVDYVLSAQDVRTEPVSGVSS